VDSRQLFIDGTEVPLSKGEAIPITRSIIDIKEPWNRKSDHTKEFLLPASKEANKVFNYIFDINIDSTFDPNLKLPAQYIEGGETIIDGFVRLLNIKETDDQEKFYQIQVLGSVSNIFREMGEKELDDAGMNWGELDHALTAANQSNSWATSYVLNGVPTAYTLGSGYVYAPIFRGRWTNHLKYRVEDLQPSTFAREILLRMFEDAGYTWNSTFLDSTYFKSLMIPMNIAGDMSLGDLGIAPRLFDADTPKKGATASSSVTLTQDTQTGFIARMSNETNDPSNAYDSVTTGIWTVPQSGYYNIITNLDLTLNMLPTAAANPCIMNGSVNVSISIIRGSNSTPLATNSMWITADADVPVLGRTTTGTAGTYPDNDYNSQAPDTDAGSYPTAKTTYPRNLYQPNQINTQVNNVYLIAGETVATYVGYLWEQDEPTDTVGDLWGTGNGPGWFIDTVDTTTSYDGVCTLNMTSGTLYNNVSNPQLIQGGTVDYNTVLPKKVKQRDFFKGIINMHNLFISQDPDNPKILNIEPAMDYYTDTAVSWAEKYAQNKPKDTIPMGAIDGVEYEYTYKPDKDYYNKIYTDEWLRPYGNREFELDNDFEKGTVKTQVLFSPTISVGEAYSDMIVPWIVKDNQQNQYWASIDSNVRILYYGGLKSTNINWEHEDTSGSTFYGTYPYLGMWDDPYNPTVSLEFGLSRKVYWTDNLGTITATNNNLFNKYYKQYIQEIIDPNSKIVKAWFALTPYDVRTADFTKLYWWDNAYYRLNKIINYKENQLTQCEFLKIQFADPFVASVNVITGSSSNDLDGELVPVGDYPINPDNNTYKSQSGDVNGEDNIVSPSAIKVSINGDNNLVGDGSENILISGGDNNIITGGLKNVTLINTSNTTVTKSNTTYIDGVAMSGDNVVKQKTADFTAQLEVTTYEVDTSGGDVIVTLDGALAYEGKIWRIKKTSSAGQIRVTTTKTYTVEDQSDIYINNLNTNIPFQFDGETNFIIL
jgi:hypothetical protein